MSSAFTQASRSLHNAIPKAEWTRGILAQRKRLGAVKRRHLIGFESGDQSPATYRAVLFRTDFEDRTGLTETVVLQKEDSVYRVTAYRVEI